MSSPATDQFIAVEPTTMEENPIGVFQQLCLAAISDLENSNNIMPPQLRFANMPSSPPPVTRKESKTKTAKPPKPVDPSKPAKKPAVTKPRKFDRYGAHFPNTVCKVSPVNIGTGKAVIVAVEHTIITAIKECGAGPNYNISTIEKLPYFNRRIVAFADDISEFKDFPNMPNLNAAMADAQSKIANAYRLKQAFNDINIKLISHSIVSILAAIANNAAKACMVQPKLKRYTLNIPNALLFASGLELETTNSVAFMHALRYYTNSFVNLIARIKEETKQAKELKKIEAAIKAGTPLPTSTTEAAKSESTSEEEEEEEDDDYDASTDEDEEPSAKLVTKKEEPVIIEAPVVVEKKVRKTKK